MTGLAAQAMSLLSWLVQNFGAELVMATFNVMTGSTSAMIIEDTANFVASILTAIRSQVDDETLRAELDAQYNAADAAADLAEKAKFG